MHNFSIRNKLQLLAEQVKRKIYILSIWEINIDKYFLYGKFLFHEFSSPYRLDYEYKGGGIMLYVKKDLPSNFLASGNKPIESFNVELNLKRKQRKL